MVDITRHLNYKKGEILTLVNFYNHSIFKKFMFCSFYPTMCLSSFFLFFRVQQLHERYLNLRMNFQNRLLHVLATRTLKVVEKKVSKPCPLSLEKLIETNKSFKFLQECIDWVHNKLVSLKYFYFV